jgi:hypothetical protein
MTLSLFQKAIGLSISIVSLGAEHSQTKKELATPVSESVPMPGRIGLVLSRKKSTHLHKIL